MKSKADCQFCANFKAKTTGKTNRSEIAKKAAAKFDHRIAAAKAWITIYKNKMSKEKSVKKVQELVCKISVQREKIAKMK